MNGESLNGCEANFFNSQKIDDISDEDKLNIFRLNIPRSDRIGCLVEDTNHNMKTLLLVIYNVNQRRM